MSLVIHTNVIILALPNDMSRHSGHSDLDGRKCYTSFMMRSCIQFLHIDSL